MAMILKSGDRGTEVRKLQMLLNAALVPNPHLREDGDFGTRTRDAVVRLQKIKGLSQDGIVGAKTWTALGQKTATAPSPLVVLPADAHWMAIAQAELEIHEDSLPGHQNQRILEYHKTTTLKAREDEVPWCSSFVNWVMTKAGYKGTNNALARSWLEWGTPLASPRAGGITVIKRKAATSDAATGSATGFHVAFCVSSTSAHLRLLGGNQHDSVRYSNFALASYEVRGCRWPT